MKKLFAILFLLPGVASGAMTTHGLGSVTDEEICTWEATGTQIDCDLAIGTDIQAWDTELDVIAALTSASGAVMFAVGGVWVADLTPAIDCTDCTNIPTAAHTIASHSDTTGTGPELDTLTSAGDADALHTHPSINTEINTDIATHAALGDEHHVEAHTVASHSDTTGTGPELDNLTDGTNADALHSPAGGAGETNTHSS